MTRLSSVAFICIAVCAGAITLALRVGQSNALAQAAIFTAPDGTPCPEVCLFGAEPGKTSYAEAVRLLEQHPFTRALHLSVSSNERFSAFESKNAGFAVQIAKAWDSDTLAWIVLTNANFGLMRAPSGVGSLGDMIGLLGAPTAVGLSDSDLLTYAYYAANRIVLSAFRTWGADTVPISIDDPVYAIQLSAPGQPVSAAGEIADMNTVSLKQWKGFGRVGKYRAAPTIEVVP